MKKAEDFDAYARDFPPEVQKLLKIMRAAIKKAVPGAEEVISYGMPGYKLEGMLVWFGGHTNHIGFYPKASGITAFKKELSVYKSSKGAVQFPLDKPLPMDLIIKIVKYNLAENMMKTKAKKKK